jgi:hypothetical protein
MTGLYQFGHSEYVRPQSERRPNKVGPPIQSVPGCIHLIHQFQAACIPLGFTTDGLFFLLGTLMIKLEKLQLAWFDHRTDFPRWIASGIGQVVAEWSVLERELEELIRLLMDADIQTVRIVTNRMNARTRISTATNLIKARILQRKLKKQDRTRFVKLGKTIQDKLQSRRDMLAHGLWTKYQSSWCVMKLRQSRATPQLMPTLKTLSRAVLPQREVITRNSLRIIARDIAAACRRVVIFCGRVERALSPLQHTPPKYSRRRRDYHLRRR